jgi:WD40 repeat protein
MRKTFFLLVSAIIITACASKPMKPNSMGDVYVLTSTKEARNLFRVSSDCFVNEIKCPTVEPVPAFPKDFARYIWVDMYWSPDGKFAFFVDSQINETKDMNLHELLLYNSANGTVEKLISGYKYISGITWNPNSKWAAMAIKKPGDKDMQIVLVSPNGDLTYPPIKHALDAGYPPYVFNGQVFDDNQRPVQWLNENEIIFVRERGETQTENSDWLSGISIMRLFKFSILTGVETELDLPIRTSYYKLSPDGFFAYFTANEIVKTYNFETKEIIALNDFPPPWITANWSPDGKWLLVCGEDNATYVVTPDMKTKQKIMDDCPIYPVWMPDSDHVILFFFSYDKHTYTITESQWFIASISEDRVREIVIPGLDLKGKNVNGIYIQPVKSQIDK